MNKKQGPHKCAWNQKGRRFSDETIGHFLNKLGENGEGRWEERAILGKGGIFLQGNESPGNFRHGFRQIGEALAIVSGKYRFPAGRVGFVIFWPIPEEIAVWPPDDPARRAAKAQNSRSFPTMIPGARVCLPMQAQRNSRACSEERGKPVMAQGAKVVLPSDCRRVGDQRT